MARYVALLRGINVGGKNPVPMADLRAACEDLGLGDVTTYIQSGNVLFSSSDSAKAVAEQLEEMLEQRYGVSLFVVVRSHRQLRSVVERAPAGFADADKYHSDVVFLRPPLSPAKAMKVVKLREGVDEVWKGTGVLYFRRLSAERTRSLMGRMVGTPEYKQMTIRSWATTTKLLSLLDESTG